MQVGVLTLVSALTLSSTSATAPLLQEPDQTEEAAGALIVLGT